MSATTEISPDELREQIDAHKQELAEAERELGVATLDGKSTAAATKRAREAREGISRCESALEELERREAQAEEERRTGEASKVRRATYESLDPYLDLIENYTRRRDEFEAAEKALLEYRVDRRFRATKGGYGHVEESDLDTGLIGAIPDIADARYQRGRKDPGEVVRANLKGMMPARARALRALAKQRAEEERSGNGVDRSQQRDTWNAEQRQRFEAELAQAEEA